MLAEASEVMPNLEKEAILAEVRLFDPLTRLPEFSSKYPFAMQILRVGGVHPTEDITTMDNPYTGKPHIESFTNVGEHGLAVASLTQTLAIRLHQGGTLSAQDVDLATSRALVHDANKRFEVMRRNALREGLIDDAYSPKAYETIRPILLAQGVSVELTEYMVRAGSETGGSSIKDFLRLEGGMPVLAPGRIVDKIIHLADDMTSTSIPLTGERPRTFFLTPWERIVASDFTTRYPFMWTEGFAFDSEGQVVNLSDIEKADQSLRWVKSYAYWQPFTSNEICREIQNIVDPESKQRPEYFVKDLVNNILVP